LEPEPGAPLAPIEEPPDRAVLKHTRLEDAQAYLAGSLLFAFSIAITSASGLLTGGTSGVALLGHYATGISFGRVLFVANIPFYVLAVRKLGWRFTRRTFLSVVLVTGFSELMPHVVKFERIDPFFAAVTGGLIAGTAVLILFRHGASLGGINVLAFFLHERFGWRAGTVQLVADSFILLSALAIATPGRVALSVLGMVVFNGTLVLNHRTERYLGT